MPESSRKPMRSQRLTLFVVLLLLVLSVWDKAFAQSSRPPSPYEIENFPITIAVSTVGDFGKGRSWHLSVNSAGKSEITIDTSPGETRREFQVTADQMAKLRESLLRERFFELADEYGQQVPDGSTDTITIVAGDAVKTVKIHFLMNWVESSPSKLHGPARALRVLRLIRGWFDDREAVDLRPYDQMVIEAAEESLRSNL